MIDPVTAIAGATAAFNMLKKGIAVGKTCRTWVVNYLSGQVQ